MIPKPCRDGQGRVQGEFYPLQKAELIALRKTKLINNTAFVHLALRYENPFCDRPITVIPKEFALRWQMPESSVYEALAKLKDSHAINIRSGRVTIEWAYSQEEEFDDSQQCSSSENPENFWESRKNSGSSEKIPEVQKKFRKFRKNSGSSEKHTSKPSSDNDSSPSKINKTYSDFIKTLSKEERSNFLNFCQEKIKNLSQEVNDIEAWLAHQNKAGQNRWEIYYQMFQQSQQKQGKLDKNESARNQFQLWKQEIEEKERRAAQMWEEERIRETFTHDEHLNGGET
ncbi:MAG: hypothetical protein KME28_25160 [Pelatocladus maniniholoensis HA4357-MV3]|jgi:hypothetical protein|uniref:Uncharacterized protein n=1 Tax=Pelatocladus maniniholoensis HA4357-MV3 TaxID=1117104 RepID=A0A9E3LWI4_9NOST|nr:hypothetical protein [Pelatocladus maniniholoensis HA4357-MV3]BAZ71050.1 hypothetical protein NIES4106_58470 [Fischerella sp. NIES-4106]